MIAMQCLLENAAMGRCRSELLLAISRVSRKQIRAPRARYNVSGVLTTPSPSASDLMQGRRAVHVARRCHSPRPSTRAPLEPVRACNVPVPSIGKANDTDAVGGLTPPGRGDGSKRAAEFRRHGYGGMGVRVSRM